MNFNVSAKNAAGKWWRWGKIEEGKYGPRLSFKNTPEFKEWLAQQGDWINFSLYEEKEAPNKKIEKTPPAQLDDEIPFD